MTVTLGEIAALIGGELHGEAGLQIHGADILRDAQSDHVTFAESSRVASELAECPAAAVIVPRDFVPEGRHYIAVDDVHASFAQIVERFRPCRSPMKSGIDASATVSASASIATDATVAAAAFIGDNVSIGPGAVIHSGVRILEGCQVGAGVTIYPNAVLYEHTRVGDRVIIHAGAVVGCYGFGYRTEGGVHQLTAQLGAVVIEDDVEIGAGATIDRGTYGDTTIGSGTKIDNQVQIAHNCRIGKHNLICSQVGIAGSCTTGDYVVMAGQVGLRDHIDIGQQVMLGAKSGVMNSIPDGQVFMGIPATEQRDQKVKQVAFSKLPEMRKQFKELQRRVQQLEQPGQREAA